jgi:hypothetical protein
MAKGNVKFEGQSSEVNADTEPQSGDTGEFRGNPDNGEADNGAGGGTELSAAISVGSGIGNSGDSSSETGATPRKKPGRPKGSTNANAGKSGVAGKRGVGGGGRNHTELRLKLEEGLTGATCFGFSAFGSSRAAKYKKSSIGLANAVFGCYQIKEANARVIAKPLSECLVEYLPDTWLQGIASTIDPVQVCAGFYLIVKQCMDNEKRVVEEYHKRLTEHNQRQENVSPPQQEAPPHEQDSENEARLIEMAISVASGMDVTEISEQVTA